MSRATLSHIDLGNVARIINSPNPVSAQDAATKAYIDGLMTVDPGEQLGRSISSVGAAIATGMTRGQQGENIRFNNDHWISLNTSSPTYNATFDAHYGVVIDPNASIVRIIPTGHVRIASFAEPIDDGQSLRMYQDTGGSTSVTLLHDDANEANTARRIYCGSNDFRLLNLHPFDFHYYRSRWRKIGERPAHRVDSGTTSRLNRLHVLSGDGIDLAGADDLSNNEFRLTVASKRAILVSLTNTVPSASAATTNLSTGIYTIPGGTIQAGTTFHGQLQWKWLHGSAATPTLTFELLYGGVVLSTPTIVPNATGGTYFGTTDIYLRFLAAGASVNAVTTCRQSNSAGSTDPYKLGGSMLNHFALDTTVDKNLEFRMRMTTAVAGDSLEVYIGYIERMVK